MQHLKYVHLIPIHKQYKNLKCIYVPTMYVGDTHVHPIELSHLNGSFLAKIIMYLAPLSMVLA